MGDAKRDSNYVTTLLAVSLVDGVTPVTLWADPTTHRLLVDISGGTGGGHIIQDEGVSLTQRAKLNFVGAGVTATDDSGNDATVVTIPGGSLSFNILRERLTGTQSGADVTLNLASLSQTYASVINIFRLGVALNPTAPNAEYSKSGSTITIFNADASEIFLVEYTYSGGGVGDVAGPASSVLNNVAVFADTTGKVIKDSGILYTDITTLGNSTTGTGSIVRATSPTLVTPALGTPTALVLTNATGLPIAGITGLGTGVGTALAVNIGSAGAFVAFNGALGTPSSGTLTNATGLPIAGLVASTSTAIGVGSIELGHASDTTISRSSAGVIAVEGVVIPSISSTNTLSNKRVTRRLVTTNAPGATPTTNTDNVDVMNFTGLAAAITSMTTNLSGTPTDGDLLEIRFTDNGTARAITWGASFASTTVTLPTTTVISTMLRVGFEWNGSVWQCIATA